MSDQPAKAGAVHPEAEAGGGARAVELSTAFGPVVRGVQQGRGPDWVILLHEPRTDLDAWGELPAALAGDGLTTLQLDLPGHGLSDDPWDPAALVPALLAAVEWAREREARLLFLVGAGASAAACLAMAAEPLVGGIVALSPAVSGERRARTERRQGGVAKLVFAGTQPRAALAAARRSVAGEAGWTMLSAIPTGEQGTGLLSGRWGDRVQEQIVGFVRQCRWAAARGAGSGSEG